MEGPARSVGPSHKKHEFPGFLDHPQIPCKNIKLPYDNSCVYGILTSRNRTAVRVALELVITYHSCRTRPERIHSYSKEKIN
jgi:hypothetical protein